MDVRTFLTCTFLMKRFSNNWKISTVFLKVKLFFDIDINYIFASKDLGFSPPPNPPCCTFCPEYITMFMAARTPQGACLIGCDRPLSYPLTPCRYIARLTDQGI